MRRNQLLGYAALLLTLWPGSAIQADAPRPASSVNVESASPPGFTPDTETPLSPIARAVLDGDVDDVRRLLDAGASPNTGLDEGQSLLALACGGRGPSSGMVDLLIQRGARVNGTDRSGQTPLMLAASFGNVAAIKALLAHGANVHRRDRHGATALLNTAAWQEPHYNQGRREKACAEAVPVLTAAGAKLDARTRAGLNALDWAAGAAHTRVLRALLDAGARTDAQDQYGRTALAYCADRGRSDECVMLLTAHGAPVGCVERLLLGEAEAAAPRTQSELSRRGPHRETALMLAALVGDPVLTTRLCDLGAKANARDDQGLMALFYALGMRPAHSLNGSRWHAGPTKPNREQLVQALLLRGADPSMRDTADHTPLDYAIQFGRKECVEAMAMHPRADLTRALAAASKSGDLDTVRWLLERRARPNGRGALLGAIRAPAHQMEIATLLLAAGADANGEKGQRGGPLMAAVISGDVKQVRLLLDHGANPRPRTALRPMVQAARMGYSAIVSVMLQAGVDPNQKDTEGSTALIAAAQRGWEQVVGAMLQAGAKPAIRDRKGRSALDYANEKGFHKIVELLQAAEANDR